MHSIGCYRNRASPNSATRKIFWVWISDRSVRSDVHVPRHVNVQIPFSGHVNVKVVIEAWGYPVQIVMENQLPLHGGATQD